METHGLLAPDTESAAREDFVSMGPASQTVTKEVAKAMEFDRSEYRERVTGEVVETARDAMFASLLLVHVGSSEEFESWCADNPDLEVHLAGNENVDRRAWHPVPAADAVSAVTFHEQADAAVATVRRQAFGQFYREIVEDGA